jgi:alpha-tubulin suppressor-like RCC1 family protein
MDSSGLVYAWGRNQEGQLGNDKSGSGQKELTPVKVHDGEMNTMSGFLENIVAVSAGEQHSIGLGSDGRVYTWGDNKLQVGERYGKLGNGNTWSDLIDTPCYSIAE